MVLYYVELRLVDSKKSDLGVKISHHPNID